MKEKTNKEIFDQACEENSISTEDFTKEGLNVVELVMQLEGAFDIELRDEEWGKCENEGQLWTLVQSKITTQNVIPLIEASKKRQA